MRKFKYVKSIMLYGYGIRPKILWGTRDNPVYRRVYLQCLGIPANRAHWDRPWLMEAATWTRKIK